MLADGEGRETTMALRDLSLRLGALTTSEARLALPDFSRPWGDGQFSSRCAANICVHYVNPVQGAASGHTADVSSDAWAQLVLDTLVHVSQTYQASGYRAPRPDGPRADGGPYGGSEATDIYLADVGAHGKYGFCSVDVNSSRNLVYPPVPGRSDVPAFCVLDNDYQRFPGTPEENLRATAAHEYFHAVQFGYDYGEDRWFMEASATWAEEQVYDEINDNVQYLPHSQLRYPGISMDTYGGAGGALHYGDWIFFQYLTERVPARTGPMPNLMHSIWHLADSVAGPDYFSMRAIAGALAGRGLSFQRMFARYAEGNRHPWTTYSEGAHFPVGRPARATVLRPAKRSTAGSFRVDHLASKTVRFTPRRLPGKGNKLRIGVDMANRATGSLTLATVYFKNGGITTRFVKLNRRGDGAIRTAFNGRTVARVELTLVNANRSYRNCWNAQTDFSCRGIPVRDDVLERYTARVVR